MQRLDTRHFSQLRCDITQTACFNANPKAPRKVEPEKAGMRARSTARSDMSYRASVRPAKVFGVNKVDLSVCWVTAVGNTGFLSKYDYKYRYCCLGPDDSRR